MKRKYTVLVCDRCSTELDPAGRTTTQLRPYAKGLGWRTKTQKEPRDICPKCIERGKA